MNSESPPPGDNRLGLDQCIEHIRFARAVELARTGKYSEAIVLLCPNGQPPESPRELDLLARMAARQERFDEAAQYWQSALKKDPGNISYSDSLQQLSELQSEGGTNIGISRFALLGVGGLLILLLLFLLFVWKPGISHPHIVRQTTNTYKSVGVPDDKSQTSAPSQAGSPSGGAAQGTIPAREADSEAFHNLQRTIGQIQQTQLDQVQTLGRQIAAVQTNQAALLDGQHEVQSQIANLVGEVIKTQTAVDSLAEIKQPPLTTTEPATKAKEVPLREEPQIKYTFQVPGITVRPQSNGCIVIFDKGLFCWDDHLGLGAKPLLQSVARAIVQTQEKIKIEIVGFAENESPTWPWQKPKTDAALGQLRAKRVKIFLECIGIFPADVISATNGPPSERPFPTGTMRNRTVILRIHQP